MQGDLGTIASDPIRQLAQFRGAVCPSRGRAVVVGSETRLRRLYGRRRFVVLHGRVARRFPAHTAGRIKSVACITVLYIQYKRMQTRFERDPERARRNLKLHGVSF